jgi:HD-GYP domain-containing protein (c-di-GMP phosphodiesterase class II)
MIQTLDIISADADMPASVQFEMRHLEDKYRDQILTMACTLVSLVDLRDSYTGGHSTRVADYVRPIALQMQLTDREIETVIMAASLHDIGKIGVPEHILRKPGKLTEEEFEYIRKHPEFGWMVLRGVDGFEEVGEMMLHHHERLDGGGYPGGLSGDEIPLGARIIAVADSFDAISSDRPYRKAAPPEEAAAELCRCAGTQFDPDVVEAFMVHLKRRYPEITRRELSLRP